MQLLGQLRPECKLEFLEWVHKEYNPRVEPGNGVLEESESGADLGIITKVACSTEKSTTVVSNSNMHTSDSVLQHTGGQVGLIKGRVQ